MDVHEGMDYGFCYNGQSGFTQDTRTLEGIHIVDEGFYAFVLGLYHTRWDLNWG